MSNASWRLRQGLHGWLSHHTSLARTSVYILFIAITVGLALGTYRWAGPHIDVIPLSGIVGFFSALVAGESVIFAFAFGKSTVWPSLRTINRNIFLGDWILFGAAGVIATVVGYMLDVRTLAVTGACALIAAIAIAAFVSLPRLLTIANSQGLQRMLMYALARGITQTHDPNQKNRRYGWLDPASSVSTRRGHTELSTQTDVRRPRHATSEFNDALRLAVTRSDTSTVDSLLLQLTGAVEIVLGARLAPKDRVRHAAASLLVHCIETVAVATADGRVGPEPLTSRLNNLAALVARAEQGIEPACYSGQLARILAYASRQSKRNCREGLLPSTVDVPFRAQCHTTRQLIVDAADPGQQSRVAFQRPLVSDSELVAFVRLMTALPPEQHQLGRGHDGIVDQLNYLLYEYVSGAPFIRSHRPDDAVLDALVQGARGRTATPQASPTITVSDPAALRGIVLATGASALADFWRDWPNGHRPPPQATAVLRELIRVRPAPIVEQLATHIVGPRCHEWTESTDLMAQQWALRTSDVPDDPQAFPAPVAAVLVAQAAHADAADDSWESAVLRELAYLDRRLILEARNYLNAFERSSDSVVQWAGSRANHTLAALVVEPIDVPAAANVEDFVRLTSSWISSPDWAEVHRSFCAALRGQRQRWLLPQRYRGGEFRQELRAVREPLLAAAGVCPLFEVWQLGEVDPGDEPQETSRLFDVAAECPPR